MKSLKCLKIFALVLIIFVLFVACSSEAEETEDSETADVVTEDEPEVVVEESEYSEDEDETATEEAAVYTNPLTGETTETDMSANRPYLVMLNTIKAAMPQYGNSKADLYYEILEEGGITRILGVYQDFESVGNIGSIRSTRQYYVQLAYALDGFLVHCGASTYGFSEISALGIDNVNEQKMSSGVFYRNSERSSAGYAYEHTLFAYSENIVDWVENSSGYETQHTDSWVETHYHTFVDDGTPDGDTAETVTVTFSGYKSTTFTYDEESGKYSISMYGEDYIDAETGETVTVTNVIVIKTSITVLDDKGYVDVELLGSGDGYFVCGGKYIPITWSKDDLSDLFTFTDEDGNEISLGVGKTYICVIPTSRDATFE